MSAVEGGAHRFSDLIAEVATPDVLRDNPFRVLGVPTDAPAREVRRAAERLKVEQRLEGDGESDGAERTEEAQRRLRDPDRRLMAELLWFWPDEAGGAAVHNAAVTALQDFAEAKPSVGSCRQALEAMASALGDHRIASYLDGRVRALDDKRLTTDDARHLLQAAQLLLPLITLRIARDHGESASGAGRMLPARLAEALRSDSIDVTVIREAERQVVGPMLERVRSAAERAVRSTRADMAEGIPAAGRLLEETHVDRRLASSLLASGDLQLVGLDDLLVDNLLTCVIPCYNQAQEAAQQALAGQKILGRNSTIRDLVGTEDAVLEILGKAKTELRQSPASGARLDANLKTIRANSEAFRCWFCRKNACNTYSSYEADLYGNEQTYYMGRTTRRTWQTLRISIPRCEECAEVHRRDHKIELASRYLWSLAAFLVGLPPALLMRNGWILLVAGIIALVVAGVLGGRKRDGKATPADMRAREFPPVQARFNDDWRFGKSP